MSSVRGERNGTAKLDDSKVVEMRKMYREGMSGPQLGRIFGVSAWTSRAALRGTLWSHVPEPVRPEEVHKPVAKPKPPKKGMRRGMTSPSAKLTDSEVRAIRDLYVEGLTILELAQRFGVSSRAIRAILCGKSWRHVSGPDGKPAEPVARRRSGPKSVLTPEQQARARVVKGRGYRRGDIGRLAAEFGVRDAVIARYAKRGRRARRRQTAASRVKRVAARTDA